MRFDSLLVQICVGLSLGIICYGPEVVCASLRANDAELIEKVGRVGRLLAGQIVAFSSLMIQANITDMCSALVVFGSPRYCDCLQCLSEAKHFREKYCKFGELVRTSEELRQIHSEVMSISGVDYLSRFLADDFYTAYCDVERCPSIPQRCCIPFKEKAPRDDRGCPLCLPVDEHFNTKCLFTPSDKKKSS